MIRRLTSAPKPSARVRPYVSTIVSPGSSSRRP